MNSISHQKWLNNLSSILENIEQEGEKNKQSLHHTQSKTDTVLTLFFVCIILFALLNVYFVYQWTQEAKSLVVEIETVHTHLETISNQMVGFNHSMAQMHIQTQIVPIINDELGHFVTEMHAMDHSTQAMQHSLTQVNHTLSQMNQDYHTLNGQFHQLNQTVGQMKNHVGEMAHSLPIR